MVRIPMRINQNKKVKNTGKIDFGRLQFAKRIVESFPYHRFDLKLTVLDARRNPLEIEIFGNEDSFCKFGKYLDNKYHKTMNVFERCIIKGMLDIVNQK